MFVCPECGETGETAEACLRDGAVRADASNDAFLGLTMGRYRVTRLIGSGGMGRVYRAVQPEIGGRVAIKVLSESALEPRFQERFFAEARAVNLIRHENIVNIVDLARLPDGRPYIVMEHLDGVPLSSVFRGRGPLPLSGFLRLMLEVLDGVGAAHDKSVVHRDLKPDNIFVSPQGHATVLDFGIAKLAEAESAGITQTGALLGTPKYMSPEQVMGLTADARADVYSLGIILYEGVVGAPPFTGGPSFELMRQHVEMAPMPPSVRRPDTPALLERVIMRALDKRPERRFLDAHDMRRGLFESLVEVPHDSLDIVGQRPVEAREPNESRQARDALETKPALLRPSSDTPARPMALGDTTRDLPRTIATLPHTIAPSFHAPPAPPQMTAQVGPKPRAALWPFVLAALVMLVAAGGIGTALFLHYRDAGEPTSGSAPGISVADEEKTTSGKKAKKDKDKKTDGETESDKPHDKKPLATISDDDLKPSSKELAQFDVLAWIDRATTYARAKFHADAQLVMLYAPVRLSDGNVDLSSEGDAVYYFISPALHGAADGCAKYVSIGARGPTLGRYPETCDRPPMEGKPHCTLAQAIKRAMKAELADTNSKQATLQYLYVPSLGFRWSIVSVDGKSSFVADDCK